MKFARYALLIGLPLLAFWPVTSAQFVTWDDMATVTQNPNLNPVSWNGIARYWREPAMDLYVPVTYAAWGALASLPQGSTTPTTASAGSSLDPAWFHGANLALHLLSTLLVYAILRRLLGTDWPAAIGALVFALHPVQVEPVAWVSGLKDVLSGALSLLALYCYVRLSTPGSTPSRARAWFASATLAFVLALLAKPSAVVVPLLAIVLGHWALTRPLGATVRQLIPWLVLSIGCALITNAVQPALQQTHAPLWARPFVAGDALTFYIAKLLFPLQLAVDYGRTPGRVLSEWTGFVMWIVPTALGLAIWRYRARMPLVWTGVLLFCAVLLPVMGLVPFDFQRYSTVADHYLYVAMLGPALIAGAVVSRARRWPVFVVATVALALLATKSYVQTQTWQSSRALYTHMLDVNPRSYLAHNDLGYELASAGEFSDAQAHYQEAIRLYPDYRDAHYNLAFVRDHFGDRAAAIAGYREALRIDPDYLAARQNLAAALDADGQWSASVVEMRRVLRQVPDSAVWHANTGAVLAKSGQYEEATREYQEALRLQPGFPRAVQALNVLRGRRN